MTDVVVVSLENWDDVWRRNQHLVDGLLRSDPELRVLFVEPADDPLHALSRRRRASFGVPVHAIGHEGRLLAFRPVKPLPRRIDPRADSRVLHAIIGAVRRAGFVEPVLWVNDPRLADLMTATGWPTLYDITDDWLAASRSSDERARIASGENSLLAGAAEVVVCSPELLRRKAPQRPKARHPITLIRNGVDAALYTDVGRRPSDLPAGRTAVYTGTIHADRFDVEVTLQTAATLGADGTVVLVGPNLLSDSDTERLRSAGVALLGSRHPQDLVGYMQHADVLIVPHIVDDFTDSLDPIKLYEYQAAGRPVVSTPVAGFRDAVDDAVVIASPDRFPDAVRAVRASPPGRAYAEPADWSERAVAMSAVLLRASGGL